MSKCVFCGGNAVSKKVTFVYESEDRFFFVKHVPAAVCTKCGEKTYAPKVTDKLLNYAKREIKPVKIEKVPVFNFAVKTL
jgi:YgiT-type zinc finger domain-containing protein